MTLGVKFAQSAFDLRVLVDSSRLEKFKHKKPIYNGAEQNFNFILPDDKFDADLIIIATKSSGLECAIAQIKNFVGENTRIISLVNGVSSEEKISNVYKTAKVVKSYFIGHSAQRVENSVIQDGVFTITIEHDTLVEEIFKTAGIDYKTADDIDYSLWLKFALNMFSNPVSAILNMTFGELKANKNFLALAKNICKEVRQVAQKKGVKNLENFESEALKSLELMCDEGKTSMLQDILAKRKTENDIFAGEMIKLGEKYGVETPYSKVLYGLIKVLEEKNEHSIHTR